MRSLTVVVGALLVVVVFVDAVATTGCWAERRPISLLSRATGCRWFRPTSSGERWTRRPRVGAGCNGCR